jgi:hypothetical protein
LDAAERDMDRAASDPGVLHSFYLLTQLPDAVRSDDFAASLRALGLQVAAAPSPAELSAALSDAIDRHIDSTRRRTDLGDMAQSAAKELTEDRTARFVGYALKKLRLELRRGDP